MSNDPRRLKVLSNAEIDDLYSLPVFDHSDRQYCFSMEDNVKKFVFSLRKFESRVYFILLLGYFRAKPLIHNFKASDVPEDINYVLNACKLNCFEAKKFLIYIQN